MTCVLNNAHPRVLQEDVNQFMKLPGNGTTEVVLKRFDEQYKKYKFLEANLLAKRKRYDALADLYSDLLTLNSV